MISSSVVKVIKIPSYMYTYTTVGIHNVVLENDTQFQTSSNSLSVFRHIY